MRVPTGAHCETAPAGRPRGGAHVQRCRRPPAGWHYREPELTSAQDQQRASALGLTSATGLVIGSIVGTGVFTMLAVLAGAGTSSLLVLGVLVLGAMLLAALFGQLTRRIPVPPRRPGAGPPPDPVDELAS
jgi:hypothetical protein